MRLGFHGILSVVILKWYWYNEARGNTKSQPLDWVPVFQVSFRDRKSAIEWKIRFRAQNQRLGPEPVFHWTTNLLWNWKRDCGSLPDFDKTASDWTEFQWLNQTNRIFPKGSHRVVPHRDVKTCYRVNDDNIMVTSWWSYVHIPLLIYY